MKYFVTLFTVLSLSIGISCKKKPLPSTIVEAELVRYNFQQGVSDGTGCGGGSPDKLTIIVKTVKYGKILIRVKDAHVDEKREDFELKFKKGRKIVLYIPNKYLGVSRINLYFDNIEF